MRSGKPVSQCVCVSRAGQHSSHSFLCKQSFMLSLMCSCSLPACVCVYVHLALYASPGRS